MEEDKDALRLSVLAAPRFAIFEAWELFLLGLDDIPYSKLGFLKFVHYYQAMLVIGVVAETAPGPVLRFHNHLSRHGIAVQ